MDENDAFNSIMKGDRKRERSFRQVNVEETHAAKLKLHKNEDVQMQYPSDIIRTSVLEHFSEKIIANMTRAKMEHDIGNDYYVKVFVDRAENDFRDYIVASMRYAPEQMKKDWKNLVVYTDRGGELKDPEGYTTSLIASIARNFHKLFPQNASDKDKMQFVDDAMLMVLKSFKVNSDPRNGQPINRDAINQLIDNERIRYGNEFHNDQARAADVAGDEDYSDMFDQ